jgi:hypothetical protein
MFKPSTKTGEKKEKKLFGKLLINEVNSLMKIFQKTICNEFYSESEL